MNNSLDFAKRLEAKQYIEKQIRLLRSNESQADPAPVIQAFVERMLELDPTFEEVTILNQLNSARWSKSGSSVMSRRQAELYIAEQVRKYKHYIKIIMKF